MKSAYVRSAFVSCRLRRHRSGACAAGYPRKKSRGYGPDHALATVRSAVRAEKELSTCRRCRSRRTSLAGLKTACLFAAEQASAITHAGSKRADFIGSEQGAADMLLPVGNPAFLRVDRAAHGLEYDGFLPRQIGDQLGAVLIVGPNTWRTPAFDRNVPARCP